MKLKGMSYPQALTYLGEQYIDLTGRVRPSRPRIAATGLLQGGKKANWHEPWERDPSLQ